MTKRISDNLAQPLLVNHITGPRVADQLVELFNGVDKRRFQAPKNSSVTEAIWKSSMSAGICHNLTLSHHLTFLLGLISATYCRS
jgi:hypothetical protein